MNRLQRRTAVFPEYGRLTILDVCVCLHDWKNANCDPPMPAYRVMQCIDLLRVCLATWEPSKEANRGFDDAVKGLIEATLREAVASRAGT